LPILQYNISKTLFRKGVWWHVIRVVRVKTLSRCQNWKLS